ncbi:hypothetical protein [Gemella morbillorum]
MGLIQEVQELSSNNKQLFNEYKKAQKEAEQATKKAEQLAKKLEQAREEKQQKKEYEKDITKAVEKDCIQCMRRCFEREGCQRAFYHLQLAATRNDILQHIPESEKEFDFLDNNYERILNKVKKQYENDQKAKNYFFTEQLKEVKKQKEIEEAEQQKKQETKNIFFNLIVFLAYAFMFGLIPFLFFYGYFTITK